MSTPDVIVSVIGASSSHSLIDHQLNDIIKEKLPKILKDTNSWIITAGIDTNATNLVAETVGNCQEGAGTIKALVVSSEKDFNDIHNNKLQNFVLLNGPTQIDETLEFRYKLEEFIKKKLNIPRILIVVEFNYHTLKAISNSIDDFSFLILFRVRLILIYSINSKK
jgi:hypothetical protein